MYFCAVKQRIMACLLHIETSTSVCSVAVSVNGEPLFEKASFDGPSHAALLGVFVEEAMAVLKDKSFTLDAVAVGGGPGSYTGLRIGTSVAKGICFGYGIPLISIPTLEIMASGAVRKINDPQALYCAMLDARRMEVYAAVYDHTLRVVREVAADIVTPETYAPYLAGGKVCFFGNGAAKTRKVITSPQAVFLENIHPLASEMIPLAENAFRNNRFEDVAYFEPFYLKEFIATVPRNKVLG